MRFPTFVCATVSGMVLAGVATSPPAHARYFGPAFAGSVVAGAIAAGAASNAYAYAPGPGYAYGYGWGPRYDGYYGGRGPYPSYGVFDESQHGGEPSYSRPLGQ